MVIRCKEPTTSDPVPPSGAGEATRRKYAFQEPKTRRGAVRFGSRRFRAGFEASGRLRFGA